MDVGLNATGLEGLGASTAQIPGVSTPSYRDGFAVLWCPALNLFRTENGL
jgi:hypothetical protein